MALLEEVAKFRQTIKTDSYSPTVKEILDNFSAGDWIIRPVFQRLFRWDLQRQSEFIESLVLNIPTPPIFVAANKNDGRYEIIDGLQRVSTLLKFFCNDIKTKMAPERWRALQNEFAADLEENNIFIPSALWAGGLLPGLEGVTAENLPDAILRTLRHSRIPVILIEPESSVEARYHVFRRLNRSGAILSDQEIRNCTARLIDDKFADRLRVLGASTTIKHSLLLSEEQEKSMMAEECILRLLANAHAKAPLSHKVSDFLDSFMETASKGIFHLTPEVEKDVLATFELINESCPEPGSLFRRWKDGRYKGGAFSTNLFDIVATGIYSNIKKLDAETVRSAFLTIMESNELNELTGAGSNTKKKFEGRIAFGKKVFRKNG
ncbi:MAG: DUF262 domain-containing protein [Candidatus Sungbacteria bacterium]|nr:DUF262 domain-containing protein [Candidatus Sungbacteria bacterium]